MDIVQPKKAKLLVGNGEMKTSLIYTTESSRITELAVRGISGGGRVHK